MAFFAAIGSAVGASSATAAAVGAAVVSTAVSAVGAITGAISQSRAAKFNAQLAERNAVIAGQQTQAELAMQRRHAAKAIGGMRAAYGASGVAMEGSPLDVLEDSVAQAELERQNIGYQGVLRAQGYQVDASLSRAGARNAAAGGYMNAASSLLSGGAQIYGLKNSASAPIQERSSWSY